MKPRLSRKALVRPDPRDGVPVLLSPERGLRLSETAAAIVALCDGTRTVDDLVAELATRYGADPPRVEGDVRRLLDDLYARGLLDGLGGWTLTATGPARATPPEAAGDTPYTLVAELTHRCPLACPYCSNPTNLVRGPEELSTDEWLRVVDEAAALGAMQLHLSGGEPLARPDLEIIAARAHERDFYVSLVTSGLPLERSRLERLAPSLDHVQLSIQDADGASSDQIAGLRSHAVKVEVARWVKELELPLTLNVVLHRANIDRVGEIVAMAERLGADRLELANVQLVSWALTNSSRLLPRRDQLDAARRVAGEARARLAGRIEIVFVLPDWHADRPRACMDGWGRRFVVVAPDGAVLPCQAARVLPLRFDGVRSASLEALWRGGDAMNAFRGESWMPEPCKSCDRRGVDFGGCRCQAYALTHDAAATDPACSLAPAHSLVLAAREAAEASLPSGADERRWIYRGRSA